MTAQKQARGDERIQQMAAALAKVLHREGDAMEISGLRRLTGGASMETWSFDAAGRPLILRRAPLEGADQALADDADLDLAGVSSLRLDQEAALLKAAGDAGVRAPDVVAILHPEDGLGAGYLMARIDGEAVPQKLLADPAAAPGLAQVVPQGAAELAKIHAMDPAGLSDPPPLKGVGSALEELQTLQARLAPEIPIFGLALGWLERNRPPETQPALLHGDFRMGNLLIGPSGITAVLDWELAHLGDPVQDLAYFCAPSWRFGRYAQAAGGLGDISGWLSAYQAAGGAPVDPARFHYWLVYATLQWGLICLIMMEIWRTGRDRTLERSVIGARASESEIDLLLLLEQEAEAVARASADSAAARIAWPEAAPITEDGAALTGGAQPAELAAALTDWATKAVIPAAQGRALFEARVARKALGIIARGAQLSQEVAAERASARKRFGVTRAELTDALRSGAMTLETPGLWAHLRRDAALRIAIEQPRYAGALAARGRWSSET